MNGKRFRILGPVGIESAGVSHFINGSHVRGALGALLLRANESVPSGNLIDALWAEPPISARVNIRTFVMKLRRKLKDIDSETSERLQTGRCESGATYRLLVGPDELDLDTFQHGWSAGRAALLKGDTESALLSMEQALALWRGPTGEDVPSGGWLAHYLSGLNEQWVSAQEDLLAARIASGQAASVIAPLRGLLGAHPNRERAAALLLVANYRIGDVPEALNTFTRTRIALIQQFAVEPGHALRQLHVAALNRDDTVMLSNRTLVS